MSYGQYIWNFLYEKIGNTYGVAGMMGNMYAESAYYPNNLQNSFEGEYNDETYTAAVDNGTYTKFTSDEYGYGLCQWTSSDRKTNLYNRFINGGYDSISNIDLQLNFLWWELNNSYISTLNVLKNATSIREASDYVLHHFEIPANASSKEEEREAYSQTAYDSFSGNYTPTYEPRLSGGDLFSNKWYIAPLNPFASSGYGLPNCTCYAWGRRGEITGEAPDTSTGSGYSWWGYNQENNVYPYGQTPKLGAICCWSYGTNVDGHVAIVEQINEDGSIITSNSGWISAEAVGTTEGFYTQTLYPEKNYCWDRADGGDLIFQGFIYLPDDYVYNPDDSDESADDSKKKNLSKFLLYAGALDLF